MSPMVLFVGCPNLLSSTLPIILSFRRDKAYNLLVIFVILCFFLLLSLIQCGKLLELKSRQTARMKGFRARAKEWAEKTKKSRNQAKVADHTALMVITILCLSFKKMLFTLYREALTMAVSCNGVS